jgi:hypothetical protein
MYWLLDYLTTLPRLHEVGHKGSNGNEIRIDDLNKLCEVVVVDCCKLLS